MTYRQLTTPSGGAGLLQSLLAPTPAGNDPLDSTG